jgi:hypothetical protein
MIDKSALWSLVSALIAGGLYWVWKQMFGEGEHEDKN